MKHYRNILIIAGELVIVFILQFIIASRSLPQYEPIAYLYFIPILLGSYWYGFKIGIAIGAVASGMAFIHSIFHLLTTNILDIFLRSVFFIAFGGIVGHLSEKERNEIIYYFCEQNYKEKFLNDPEKFISL